MTSVATIPAQSMTREHVQRVLAEPVAALIVAKAHAQATRPIIDEAHRAILAESMYLDEDGRRVTDPKLSWTIREGADLRRYYAECDAANARLGWDVEPGYCPALMAEHDVTKARWALFDAAEALTGIDCRTACCSLDDMYEYERLLCGLSMAEGGAA